MGPSIWVDMFLTLIGYALPLSVISYVWFKKANLLGFGATATLFCILSARGLDKTVPFFGHAVMGGSTYLPALFMIISLCCVRYGINRTWELICWTATSTLFFTLAQLRWAIFAMYAPGETGHAIEATMALGRNACILFLLVYVGGMIIISVQKWMNGHAGRATRFIVPCIVDMLMVMPVSLAVSAATHTIPANESVIQFLAWSFAVRMSVPLIIYFIIWGVERSKVKTGLPKIT